MVCPTVVAGANHAVPHLATGTLRLAPLVASSLWRPYREWCTDSIECIEHLSMETHHWRPCTCG